MEILKNIDNSTITITLKGWLDTAAAPELSKEIEKLDGVKEVVFDFNELEYISSSGLRVVVATYKMVTENGGAFSIINANSEVMDVFRLTGIDKKLNINSK